MIQRRSQTDKPHGKTRLPLPTVPSFVVFRGNVFRTYDGWVGGGCATVNGGQRRISLGSHKAHNKSASTRSIMLIVAFVVWTKGRPDGRRGLNVSFTYQSFMPLLQHME